MSSTSITSFFHQKPNQLTRTSSTLTGNKYDASSMRRSSTLSKVKRFGSMLVRTKQQRPMIDTTSASVRPSPSSASLVSSATTSNEDSEEEEHVITPSSSTTQFSKDVMITVVTPSTVNYQMDLDMMSVTPKGQSNQLPAMVETLEPPLSEEQVGSLATKVQTTPHRSDVAMVREQLRAMLEEIDVEIEQELESSHLNMLASIKTIPHIMY
ncbi:hypothetical protein V8B55DRAFT_1524249 [Mucor lusitanicus]|uniref:Uncharacterized protein n=2 Tax=Mucor circinelloides f. lusitanicus TaxID=29924 RepID=A0A168LQQ3_MUCCL|nr:hypothetical protein FB192DRAFT_1151380 [Mucor lusitanicus]OAD03843.1 hypothetical protein MUCCIDRAFT_163383 [Mucor lusitanicus CBS 277.49]